MYNYLHEVYDYVAIYSYTLITCYSSLNFDVVIALKSISEIAIANYLYDKSNRKP